MIENNTEKQQLALQRLLEKEKSHLDFSADDKISFV